MRRSKVRCGREREAERTGVGGALVLVLQA